MEMYFKVLKFIYKWLLGFWIKIYTTFLAVYAWQKTFFFSIYTDITQTHYQVQHKADNNVTSFQWTKEHTAMYTYQTNKVQKKKTLI